jgi:hypothetical protein
MYSLKFLKTFQNFWKIFVQHFQKHLFEIFEKMCSTLMRNLAMVLCTAIFLSFISNWNLLKCFYFFIVQISILYQSSENWLKWQKWSSSCVCMVALNPPINLNIFKLIRKCKVSWFLNTVLQPILIWNCTFSNLHWASLSFSSPYQSLVLGRC